MRIQKTVDDAHPESADSIQSNRSAVELLTEIDNVSDVDRLVQLGQDLAHDHSEALQMFVRHSLFAQADM